MLRQFALKKQIERMYITVALYVHLYYNQCTGGGFTYESQYYRIKNTS